MNFGVGASPFSGIARTIGDRLNSTEAEPIPELVVADLNMYPLAIASIILVGFLMVFISMI